MVNQNRVTVLKIDSVFVTDEDGLSLYCVRCQYITTSKNKISGDFKFVTADEAYQVKPGMTLVR